MPVTQGTLGFNLGAEGVWLHSHSAGTESVPLCTVGPVKRASASNRANCTERKSFAPNEATCRAYQGGTSWPSADLASFAGPSLGPVFSRDPDDTQHEWPCLQSAAAERASLLCKEPVKHGMAPRGPVCSHPFQQHNGLNSLLMLYQYKRSDVQTGARGSQENVLLWRLALRSLWNKLRCLNSVEHRAGPWDFEMNIMKRSWPGNDWNHDTLGRHAAVNWLFLVLLCSKGTRSAVQSLARLQNTTMKRKKQHNNSSRGNFWIVSRSGWFAWWSQKLHVHCVTRLGLW